VIESTNARPCLAVMFDSLVSMFQLAEAADGRWSILWLIDRTVDDVQSSQRMLARLGTVVDITGLDDDECAARLASYHPTGLIAFSEWWLQRAGRLGRKLGLAANSAATIECYVNKFAQREAMREAGLAVPGYWPVPADLDGAALDQLARSITYPAIVKPQTSWGSRDAYRITDETTLRAALGPGKRTGTDALIIEELLVDGWPREARPYADFVSVESIVVDGHANHLALTGRATLAEPFRETGNFVPANLSEQTADAVLALATEAIAAMGTTTGAVHTEVKLTPDGPRVIEVNGRIGGMIAELLALGGDHSLLEIACRVALGERLHFESLLKCPRVAYTLIGVPPVGATRLVELKGLQELRQAPGIELIDVQRHPGDPVDWRDGYDGRLYLLYGVAEDHQAMWAARARIADAVLAVFE
jgi:biotin carboxylase